jgi:uncharacterized repeat protein (TIGR01451 family)
MRRMHCKPIMRITMTLVAGLVLVVLLLVAGSVTGKISQASAGPGGRDASRVPTGGQTWRQPPELSLPEAGFIPPPRPLAADLLIQKSVQTSSDPILGATVSNGDTITYTIVITNVTDDAIDISKVTDILPSGTLFDVQCVTDGSVSPGTNCSLEVEETIISIPSSGRDTDTSDFVLRVTKAVVWSAFPIPAGEKRTLAFTARVDCQPAGAQISNVASVVFGIDGSVLPSTETQTTVVLKDTSLQNDSGQPLIVGPSGCSAEPGGYDQDWGDFDRDGDLDLALGTNSQTSVYRNDEGKLTSIGTYNRRAFGVRWGDIDGDQDLELISVGDYYTTTAGLRRGVNYIFDYANFSSPAQVFTTTDVLWRIDLADYNGDETLDLAAASFFDPGARHKHNLCLARVYGNNGGGTFVPEECLIGPLTKDTVWRPVGEESSYHVAWGDSDFDGDLDLAVADYGAYNRLHENNSFKLGDFSLPLGDTSIPPEHTTSMAWQDYDNDGDFDLAWGNDGERNALYTQTNGIFQPTPIWQGDPEDATHSLAWFKSEDIAYLDASIPVADVDYEKYTLPFSFPFGRSNSREIVKVCVDTKGNVELLEAGEDCVARGRWSNLHSTDYHRYNNVDVIFAASADMISGVIIEALPEISPDRVEIAWVGSAYCDGGGAAFESHPLLFKVIIHQDGRIEWKFFRMNYTITSCGYGTSDFFAGLYDEVDDWSMPLSVSGGSGTIPSNTFNRTFEFTTWAAGQVAERAWSGYNQSLAPQDDAALSVHSLPFTMPYYGRNITNICVNTNGLIELLEASESCQEGSAPYTHKLNNHLNQIDAIFAANDDLRTGVFVEGDSERVAITWMGTTDYDFASSYPGDGYLYHQLAYKVILFQSGTVRWKFYDMKYTDYSGSDLFSGAYGAPEDETDEIPGGSKSFAGYDVRRRFDFEPTSTANAIHPIGQKIYLAVGNYGPNYLYEPAGAGLSASPVWNSADSSNTTSLVWVDYDNDGDSDLVAGNYGQENRVYLMGAGLLPQADPQSLSPETDNTRSIDWADWDNDGDLDMAAGNENQPNRVYSNDGSGGLSLAWSSVETDSTHSVGWADVDDDGFPDLATGNYDTYLKLYHNDGGSLDNTPIWTSLHISHTRSIAWGDVDGDGDLDLAVANDGDRNALYQNRRYFLIGNEKRELGTVNDLAWGDYDNDGYPDLAIGGVDLEFPGGGFVYLVKNTAMGGQRKLAFTNQAAIQLDQGVQSELFDLAWGDYNRDGYLDLAAAFPDAEQVKLYRNQGGSDGWTVGQTLNGITSYGIDWADLQSDGWLDLAVAESRQDAAPELKIYLNQAGMDVSYFSSEATLVPESDLVTGTVTSLRCIDRDNDGDLDLSAVNLRRESQQFTTYGSFLNPALTLDNRVGNSGFKASGVAWGDYDGDGLLDLLYSASPDLDGSSPNPDSTRLYLNNGQGFTLAGSSAGGDPTFDSGGRRVAVFGDYDGDGDLEIADGVPGGQVKLYGYNTSPQTINGVEAYSLGWGDADGDGFLDLFVGGKLSGARQNYVFINQGTSPFLDASAPRWTSPQFERTTSVAWVDYDGDFYLDFVVGNCNGDLSESVQLYHNNGDDSFSLVSGSGLPADGWCTHSVAWADYDGDGDPDLAIGNDNDYSYVYENQDSFSGTFGQVWSSTLSANTRSVAWGDWNGDGRPELALGNYGQQDQVYANIDTTDGTRLLWLWESAQAYQTTGLAWGDADSDGDLDLAFAQNDPLQLNGVYENGYVSPAHHGQLGDMPLPRNPSYLVVHRPGTNDAYAISSGILNDYTIPITYTVFDPDGPRSAGNPSGDDIIVDRTWFEYSLNGGATWQEAVISGTTSHDGTTSRQGEIATVIWDSEANGAVGDYVLFRVGIVHQKPAGPIQRASTWAVSPPFRVQALTCEWPADASIRITVNDVLTNTVAASQTIKLQSGIGAGTGVLTYTWDLGDGTTQVMNWVEHKYTTPGTYTVALTITGEPCPVVREAMATALVVVQEATTSQPLSNSLYLPLILRPGGVSGAVAGAPSQVSGLRGRMRSSQTTLMWTPNPAAEAVLGYHVYRSPRPGTGDFELIATVASDAASYTDATAGCGYIYYVTAFNAAGESPPSTASYVSRPCR